MTTTNSYSDREEIANAITHGLGALLASAALALLLSSAILQNESTKIISFSVYGISLVLLFSASTLYHSLKNNKAKTIFKLLDHCAIYLLIAGTYTPLLFVTLNNKLGYTMLTIIWGLAISGIIFKLKFGHRYKKISLATYLGLGFISLPLINQLSDHLATQGIKLLIIGGVVYGLGVIFYVQKHIPFNHAIWHLFVLAGASCHFFMIWHYV